MKAVMITYNQVLSEEILAILDKLSIRGFTRWSDIEGRGSETGDPQMGTHTWPGMNGAILCVMKNEDVKPFIDELKEIDEEGRGLRAFVWTIDEIY